MKGGRRPCARLDEPHRECAPREVPGWLTTFMQEHGVSECHTADAEPAAAADPKQPIQHQIRGGDDGGQVGSVGPGDAPTGRAQGRRPPFMDAATRGHRGHPRAAPGQPGPGIQGVAAIVTAASEHHDPGPVDLPGQAGADRRQPGRGPLHQRPGRYGRHEGVLGRADRGHVVRFPHPSATTIATLRPPSWVIDRCQRSTPHRTAASATVPLTASKGRPAPSWVTSTSAQRSPAGAPRAFAVASLAAKHAASEAGPRPRSPSVNRREARDGVRRRADWSRATSTTSTPMPTITPPACHSGRWETMSRAGSPAARPDHWRRAVARGVQWPAACSGPRRAVARGARWPAARGGPRRGLVPAATT